MERAVCNMKNGIKAKSTNSFTNMKRINTEKKKKRDKIS